MNLRVIHLIRKMERIDRDLEELDALLGTLQMDREYSRRLRDSLVEESFRLKQLRQKISSQVIRIPEHFERFVQETVPSVRARAELRPAEQKTEPAKPGAGKKREETNTIPPATEPRKNESPAAVHAPETKTSPDEPPPEKQNGREISPGERPQRKGDRKKPPFLFRFE